MAPPLSLWLSFGHERLITALLQASLQLLPVPGA